MISEKRLVFSVLFWRLVIIKVIATFGYSGHLHLIKLSKTERRKDVVEWFSYVTYGHFYSQKCSPFQKKKKNFISVEAGGVKLMTVIEALNVVSGAHNLKYFTRCIPRIFVYFTNTSKLVF